MAQATILETSRPQAFTPAIKRNAGLRVLAFLFIVICLLFVFYQQAPPPPVAASAPAGVFSSGRAMDSLRVIAQKPHPIGSLEHAAVRTFLVRQLTALGLQTEVQTAEMRSSKMGSQSSPVTVNNVIAVLKGSGSGRAVLLAAHYDTVLNSPGASDDGAGVVALLETARALKTGPSLKNDLVFLFSDGEESNLLGAKAFVEQHPLAKQVALALNFEARGASGPVVMFETSENNSWIIGEFAKAAPYPNANSLAYEFYRRMPNSTDMHVFKASGIAGLNFAYFDDLKRYHSSSDDLQNVSEASLQHHGTYALTLARHFGDASLDSRSTDNAVYFDLFGRWLVHYSMKWVLPSTALISILFVAVIWFGRWRNRVTLAGVGRGFFAFIVSTCASIVGSLLAWGLITIANSGLGREVYPGGIYLGAFVLLSVVIAATLYSRFFRRVAVENLAMGALVAWLLLLVAASMLAPGGSYLLFWPLLFGLSAQLIMFTVKTTPRESIRMLSVQSLLALPGLVLLVPLIYQIFVAVGFFAIVIVIPMLMLLYGLLIPHFALITKHND